MRLRIDEEVAVEHNFVAEFEAAAYGKHVVRWRSHLHFAGFKNAVEAVAKYYEGRILDPITINLTVSYSALAANILGDRTGRAHVEGPPSPRVRRARAGLGEPLEERGHLAEREPRPRESVFTSRREQTERLAEVAGLSL